MVEQFMSGSLIGDVGEERIDREEGDVESEDREGEGPSVTKATFKGPTGRQLRRAMTRPFIFFKATSAADSLSKVMYP